MTLFNSGLLARDRLFNCLVRVRVTRWRSFAAPYNTYSINDFSYHQALEQYTLRYIGMSDAKCAVDNSTECTLYETTFLKGTRMPKVAQILFCLSKDGSLSLYPGSCRSPPLTPRF